MVKPRAVYTCTECGTQQPRWLGRCPGCGAWQSLVEESAAAEPPRRGDLLQADPQSGAAKPIPLAEVDPSAAPRIATGIAEFDRVLGGGLVPGSVLLLGGEPGIGKSTLCLQLAIQVQRGSGRVLYVTGEESLEQVRLRAERLGEIPDSLLALSETRVERLAEPWRELRPSLVLIDSIQTMSTEWVESAPGSVAQVRESAALLAATAKAHGTVLVLVGHVTKEGAIAGPRVLEHLVDAVLSFEGDRGHTFRLLRASKNRFGSTQEVGVFSMGEDGLSAVENPSELFLAERHAGAPGSVIVPIIEGGAGPPLGGGPPLLRRVRQRDGWGEGGRARRGPGCGPGSGLEPSRSPRSGRRGRLRRGGSGRGDSTGGTDSFAASRGRPPGIRAGAAARRGRLSGQRLGGALRHRDPGGERRPSRCLDARVKPRTQLRGCRLTTRFLVVFSFVAFDIWGASG